MHIDSLLRQKQRFPQVLMGGWLEGLACADLGAKTPISASGNSFLILRLYTELNFMCIMELVEKFGVGGVGGLKVNLALCFGPILSLQALNLDQGEEKQQDCTLKHLFDNLYFCFNICCCIKTSTLSLSYVSKRGVCSHLKLPSKIKNIRLYNP